MLPLDEFQVVVKSTSLGAIDFVVHASDGKVLFGVTAWHSETLFE